MKRGQIKWNDTHGFGGSGTDRGPSASKCERRVIGIGEDKGIGELLERVEVRNGQACQGPQASGLRADKTSKASHCSLDLARKGERKRKCEVQTQHVTTHNQRDELFNFSLKKHTLGRYPPSDSPATPVAARKSVINA